MNYKIAGQFEHLYPITLGDNVKLNSGKTLEEWKQEVDGLLNAVEDGYTEIWSGKDLLDTKGVGISPSKPLNSTRNGWILVFKDVSGDRNYNYCYVPKIHPTGKSIKFIIGGYGGYVYSKFITVTNTFIEGETFNGNNGNEKMELTKVIAH